MDNYLLTFVCDMTVYFGQSKLWQNQGSWVKVTETSTARVARNNIMAGVCKISLFI